MTRIFISYGKEDDVFALVLEHELIERGHETFSASGLIAAGQNWKDVISSSLSEADAVILLISADSMDSNWFMPEAGAALAYWRDRGKPIVIPVVLGKARLPPALRNIQAIFHRDGNATQLALEIDRSLEIQAGRLKAREHERQEIQERVEKNAAEYIEGSIDELRKKETRFRYWAYLWYAVAFFSLLSGLVFGVFQTTEAVSQTPTWESIAQLALMSIVVLGTLGAVARMSFLLGKSFMVESLRNSDRLHAISFGEFYLKAFGKNAEWSEIKEAFQHWNIDKGSSFIDQEVKDVDPQILHAALDIAKTITGKGIG